MDIHQQMLKDLKQFLIPLGLDQTEIDVFLAMTGQIAPEKISKIAKNAGHNRASVYDVLRRLSEKGLVRQISKGAVLKYEAVEPSVILSKLNDQKTEIENKIEAFENLRPELNAIFGTAPGQPSVAFYEGIEGIKNVLLDTLETPGVKEIISYVSADYLQMGFDSKFLDKYWQRRTELKIPSRGIMPGTEKAKSLFNPERNVRELRTLKFISPEKYKFTNEIDIYADKIGIISLDQNNLYGVIIKSQNIADTQRNIYELLWESIK